MRDGATSKLPIETIVCMRDGGGGAPANGRSVVLNVCIRNADTATLGIDRHVCELQLSLRTFASLTVSLGAARPRAGRACASAAVPAAAVRDIREAHAYGPRTSALPTGKCCGGRLWRPHFQIWAVKTGSGCAFTPHVLVHQPLPMSSSTAACGGSEPSADLLLLRLPLCRRRRPTPATSSGATAATPRPSGTRLVPRSAWPPRCCLAGPQTAAGCPARTGGAVMGTGRNGSVAVPRRRLPPTAPTSTGCTR